MATGQKRRVDEIMENLMLMNGGSVPSKEIKRPVSELETQRRAFNKLVQDKRQWILKQRRSSLVVDPRRIDDDGVMAGFAPLYQEVSCLRTEKDEHVEHLKLIQDIIKESVVVEWPRHVHGVLDSGHDEPIEIDQAPLIHRARNVVKCRTSHPTMRIKVYALSSTEFHNQCGAGPSTVEAFFRCTLTKAQPGIVGEQCDAKNAQVAGRMILTQREGTAASKTSTDRTGAVVNAEGKLVASQAAPDTHTFSLLARYGENVRSTPFKYENGILCATFPEMGVTLNSMVDRRQLATRYCVQVEVGVNIDNKFIVEHTMQSLPFLIAITNDQTEPLLNSIVWSRLLELENYDGSEQQERIPWGILKEACRQFVKSQIPQARSLTSRELLHFQAMMFLPKVARCRQVKELEEIERVLYPGSVFGNNREVARTHGGLASPIDIGGSAFKAERERLRMRLLCDYVSDDLLIEKSDFMNEICVSVLDGRTELRHTPWQWLFKATELILDVGHKLCPSPAIAEKKSTKTKKQLAAAEEYHTMMSLFNKGIVSFFSVYDVMDAYKELRMRGCEDLQDGGAMLIRFDDENAGHLCFVYGLDTQGVSEEELKNSKLVMGSIGGDTIKDFKQGLSEALMDEEYTSNHRRLVKMSVYPERLMNAQLATTTKKRNLFNTYQSLRQVENKTPFPEEQLTVRIHPFTGTAVNRDHLRNFASAGLLSSDLSLLSQQFGGSFTPAPTVTPSERRKRKNPVVKAPVSAPPIVEAQEPVDIVQRLLTDNLFASVDSFTDFAPVASPEDVKPDLKSLHAPVHQLNSPWKSSSSPQTSTAVSPFSTLPSNNKHSNQSQNAINVQSAEGVAAILAQPEFQNMMAQIMTQTISSMDFSKLLPEAEALSTPHSDRPVSNNSALNEMTGNHPQSLEDILRVTERQRVMASNNGLEMSDDSESEM